MLPFLAMFTRLPTLGLSNALFFAMFDCLHNISPIVLHSKRVDFYHCMPFAVF